MDAYLQSLAARGYRWYLALKIGKALLAIPLFACWITLLTTLALCIGAWDAVKTLLWELPHGMGQEARDYWRKPWFRGFARSYYRSLRQYKPAPTPLPAEDQTP